MLARSLMLIQTTHEDHRIAWLTALAISIHILESAIPSPLPGFKPGLANVITIAVLIQFGWRTAAWVSFLRVVCGSLLLGTFLSPTFVMSLGGAIFSMAVLWAVEPECDSGKEPDLGVGGFDEALGEAVFEVRFDCFAMVRDPLCEVDERFEL